MRFHTLAPTVVLALTGCAATEVNRTINLSHFDKDKPFVVGINGLATHVLEDVVADKANQLHFPYVIGDVCEWHNNLESIYRAHEEGREILLIGSSAGCHDAWLTANECKKKGIEISRMIYINPFYTLFTDPKIPSNVRELNVYFSNGCGLMEWANGSISKFKGLNNEDTLCAAPVIMDGTTHSEYKDQPTLNSDLARFFSTTRSEHSTQTARR